MVSLKEVHSNAFGGKVKAGSIEDLDKFLFTKDLIFTNSGKSYFLWNSKIPEVFFNKHPEVLQKDMLNSMKSELKINELLFLEINNEIVYCAPSSDIPMVDPLEKFPVLNEDGWKFLKRDYKSGVDKYVYSPTGFKTNPKEYTACAFLEIPLLYNGKMTFEVGLYKVICSNGLKDTINSNVLSLKKQQINQLFFQPIFEGLIESLKGFTNNYTEFLNYIKHCPIGLYDAKSLLENLIADRVLPSAIGYHMFKYFNLIESGKLVDELLPTQISNHYDILDAITYYAQKLPTLGMQTKVEAKIFEYMYTKYTEDQKVTINKINLKSFIPIQQREISETEEFIIPNIDNIVSV